MNKAIDWDAYKGIDGFRRIREFEAYFPVGGVLGDIQFPPDFLMLMKNSMMVWMLKRNIFPQIGVVIVRH